MMEKQISIEVVATKILLVHGKKVMLDRDLAEMYGVETKQLVRQVKRNIKRFPDDFMYQLTRKEVVDLKCQNGTSCSFSSKVSWNMNSGGKRNIFLLT